MASEPSQLKERAEEIEQLVLEVKKGDHDAFSQLYDIFVDPLYRYIYFRVKKDDAEDILEMAFLRVWENIDKYKKAKKKSFSSWIFRIAHNLVVDYYRTMKAKDFEELDINTPDYNREHNPLGRTEQSINSDILKTAIRKLKKQYQDIIIYKFVNDLSNKEIARILKKSEGSLRILQFRAIKALRNEFERLGVDYRNFL